MCEHFRHHCSTQAPLKGLWILRRGQAGRDDLTGFPCQLIGQARNWPDYFVRSDLLADTSCVRNLQTLARCRIYLPHASRL